MLLSLILTILLVGSVRADIPVSINEFLASNSSVISDPQGQYDDWIEIYNYSTGTINIGGIYLTDDLSVPTKWQFPDATSIQAEGYLLIWADDDIADTGLHANFKLSADGEEIGLFDRDGITLIDSITFSAQTTDMSFGRYPDGENEWRFFESPSPEQENEGGFLGVVADTKFSRDRGFYNVQFNVAITTETAGATVRYTTDGSTPTPVYGQIYAGPVRISTTTCLRAMAYKDGWLSTDVDTQTYLFLDDVVEQTGGEFPDTWGHLGADYEMDPVVVDDYDETIRDDMKSIPTVSLVMNMDDWFNNDSDPAVGGIYAHPQWERDAEEGRISNELIERTVSVEFFEPATSEQFQLNAGVCIAGGSSTDSWKMDKLSMRLKFTGRYGATKLRFPLFGDDATDEFDTLVLDARMNNSWPYGGGVMLPNNSRPWIQGRPTQRDVAQYTRDQFVSDIQNSTGGYGPHGRHIHLYLNGLYWGLYNIHERPDENFACAYFGGRDEDYDVLKHRAGTVINGSGTYYNQMFNIANGGLSSNSQYQLIQQYLDVPDLINYMITNFYVGNTDWAHQNWYATFNRVDPNGRWRYHSWDAEHVMEGLYANVTGKNDNGGPSRLHNRLRDNAEYRMLFADYVHRNFFNDGILTPEGANTLYHVRLNEVDRAVVGESARWGDNHESTPRTRDIDWERERDWLLDEYFPNRTSIVLQQLCNVGLYPDVDAPVFYIDGSYQHGGPVEKNSSLSLASESGTIWYTLDGSDPRLPGASGNNIITTLVAENAAKRVLVPTGFVSDNWKGGGSFNDSAWTSGTGGVGYEANSGYENYIDIDLYDQMYQSRTGCYIRIPFTVDNADGFDLMTLKMRYDDGFIVYLNGTEVARINFNGTPDWNSTTNSGHEAGATPEFFNISDYIDELESGENILAIHGLNQSITSSDFLISVEFIAENVNTTGDDVSLMAIMYNQPVTLTKSTRIKARVKSGNTWSALNEATYAVGPVAENLRITEIMYHPQSQAEPNDPNEEFIELTNIGAETINLNLVKFTNGIDFTFPDLELSPGEYLVVVQDRDAFEARYGTEINIAGQYSGRLANGGERIRLEDAVGQTILDFSYKDGWYDGTDSQGYSLTIINPLNSDPNREYRPGKRFH